MKKITNQLIQLIIKSSLWVIIWAVIGVFSCSEDEMTKPTTEENIEKAYISIKK